jgi:hexosaminidase
MGNHINGNSWCDPFKTWQKAYSFNPTEGLKGDQKNLVLGGKHFLFVFLLHNFIDVPVGLVC